MLEPDESYYYPRRIPVKSSLFHPQQDGATGDSHGLKKSAWDSNRKSTNTWDSDVHWDQLLLADVSTRNGRILQKKFS
jgi:hypothetical protein